MKTEETNALIASAVAAEREACAAICEKIADDAWNLYKGYAPYTGREPDRGLEVTNGKSYGAYQCAAAVRNRK